MLLSIKFLLYLVLTDEPALLTAIGEEAYPCLRNVCLFSRTRPIESRGADFFRSNHCTPDTT